jgi:hypothetical protein
MCARASDGDPSPRLSAWIVAAMVAMVAVPAAITLRTVSSPGTLQMSSSNPTPHGYSWSLLLFVVPPSAGRNQKPITTIENLPGEGCGERGTAMVAAERHEVRLPGPVESFQSPGHKASLRLRTAPLKPKDGLSGPPATRFRRRQGEGPRRPGSKDRNHPCGGHPGGVAGDRL